MYCPAVTCDHSPCAHLSEKRQTVEPLQVRTLVQQRDAAQENIKKLAAELLKAQTAADKLYRQGGAAAAPPNADAASARTAQGEASTSRHAVWHPSAERAAASRNAELARVLREIAVRDEVAVAISNERLAADGHMLEFWCASASVSCQSTVLGAAWCGKVASARGGAGLQVQAHAARGRGQPPRGRARRRDARAGAQVRLARRQGRCARRCRGAVPADRLLARRLRCEPRVITALAACVARRTRAGSRVLTARRCCDCAGLKFQILQEFLELGYAVLLSDVDILTVQNPFKFLARDADVEGMSDGWDAAKAYGFNDVFDSPEMGWSRYSHSMRVSVINRCAPRRNPPPPLLGAPRAVRPLWPRAVQRPLLHAPHAREPRRAAPRV